jgi:hypothetical protein
VEGSWELKNEEYPTYTAFARHLLVTLDFPRPFGHQRDNVAEAGWDSPARIAGLVLPLFPLLPDKRINVLFGDRATRASGSCSRRGLLMGKRSFLVAGRVASGCQLGGQRVMRQEARSGRLRVHRVACLISVQARKCRDGSGESRGLRVARRGPSSAISWSRGENRRGGARWGVDWRNLEGFWKLCESVAQTRSRMWMFYSDPQFCDDGFTQQGWIEFDCLT